MKNREQKQKDLDALAEQFKNANAAMLVSFNKMTVAKDQELRRQLHEAGVTYSVVKNTLARKAAAETFVTRAQLRRVLQVFVPTLLFCFLMQWLGLYVASFLLIAGFMVFVGRLAVWKSLLTAFLFSLVMFVTFEIAFDVIMPKGPIESLFGR